MNQEEQRHLEQNNEIGGVRVSAPYSANTANGNGVGVRVSAP